MPEIWVYEKHCLLADVAYCYEYLEVFRSGLVPNTLLDLKVNVTFVTLRVELLQDRTKVTGTIHMCRSLADQQLYNLGSTDQLDLKYLIRWQNCFI
jgi:hypothetical protein